MKKREFADRRRRLLEQLPRDSIALLATAPVQTRNNDVEHPFRPRSSFSYLTDFPEPDALAVLVPDHRDGDFQLFCRERSPKEERWTGPRAGIGGAKRRYRADQAYPIEQLQERLPALLGGRRRVYHNLGADPELDQKLLAAVGRLRGQARAGTTAPTEFHLLDPLVDEMRLFKSPAEIATMDEAARISAQAHRAAMHECRPGMTEYQIEAGFLQRFTAAGARSPAYPSIVGGGNNACVLHYTANSDKLNDGDLILIDAGAEFEGYAADITRTFPVNGRFSEAQRAIYQLVLDAQMAAIDQVRVGNHWNAPHEAAVEVLTRGLVKLDLLKGKVKELIKDHKYRRYFPHRTGHWLGMDVHDVGTYKQGKDWRPLQPGMVLTVEPGLYFPAGKRQVPKKYQGIGVRIEDDVLVTLDGPQVLTAGAPKTIDEIEALMAGDG